MGRSCSWSIGHGPTGHPCWLQGNVEWSVQWTVGYCLECTSRSLSPPQTKLKNTTFWKPSTLELLLAGRVLAEHWLDKLPHASRLTAWWFAPSRTAPDSWSHYSHVPAAEQRSLFPCSLQFADVHGTGPHLLRAVARYLHSLEKQHPELRRPTKCKLVPWTRWPLKQRP